MNSFYHDYLRTPLRIVVIIATVIIYIWCLINNFWPNAAGILTYLTLRLWVAWVRRGQEIIKLTEKNQELRTQALRAEGLAYRVRGVQ